jgi:hypothetical protein
MVYLFLQIIWAIYALFEGVREGNSQHHKTSSKSLFEINVPIIYNCQRALVLFVIALYLSTISLTAVLSVIPMILIFPYIHNGTYFIIRNKLNPSTFTDGPNSDCDVDFERPSNYINANLRTKLALLGTILQILICFIK